MRLINTTALELEEFCGMAPGYAILSHTWENDEVTFQEFSQPRQNTTAKQGHAKIAAACRLARENGIKYCWVDTCCIDKSSSSELTEAINSMFNWYKQAKVCYVYLADFTLPDEEEEEEEEAQRSISDRIGSCRWFTRGWCLQELIAHWNLNFYDSTWRLVGTKLQLQQTIHAITKVDLDVLEHPGRLSTKSIARRMSWASKRQTTRVEDMAYSLLGIFDITMPMLYGEGTKAFLRLQEEIIKKSNDGSIFSWNIRGQASAYIDMFAPSPAYFEHAPGASCRGGNGVMLSRDQFSVTNRGILFTGADLSVLKAQSFQEGPDYVLPLNGLDNDSSKPNGNYLLLRKVGPGLYARMNTAGDLTVSALERPWTVEKNIYVLAKVPHSLHPALNSCHRSSFEFRSPKANLRSHSIQGLEPLEAWDAPRSRFLTLGDSSFVGYLKIYPDMAAGEFFVVALGLRRHETRDELEPYVRLVRSSVWVVYDAPGRSLAWMVSSAIGEQEVVNRDRRGDDSELFLSEHKVTVSLSTRTSRSELVHRVLVDWKPYAASKWKS